MSSLTSMNIYIYMVVSYNFGTQQLLVFLLKMTILGCFRGTTIFGKTYIGVIKFPIWGDSKNTHLWFSLMDFTSLVHCLGW